LEFQNNILPTYLISPGAHQHKLSLQLRNSKRLLKKVQNKILRVAFFVTCMHPWGAASSCWRIGQSCTVLTHVPASVPQFGTVDSHTPVWSQWGLKKLKKPRFFASTTWRQFARFFETQCNSRWKAYWVEFSWEDGRMRSRSPPDVATFAT